MCKNSRILYILPIEIHAPICYTIIVPRARLNGKSEKDFSKKSKKTLDKPQPLWYNKDTKRVATYRQRKELIP